MFSFYIYFPNRVSIERTIWASKLDIIGRPGTILSIIHQLSSAMQLFTHHPWRLFAAQDSTTAQNLTSQLWCSFSTRPQSMSPALIFYLLSYFPSFRQVCKGLERRKRSIGALPFNHDDCQNDVVLPSPILKMVLALKVSDLWKSFQPRGALARSIQTTSSLSEEP